MRETVGFIRTAIELIDSVAKDYYYSKAICIVFIAACIPVLLKLSRKFNKKCKPGSFAFKVTAKLIEAIVYINDNKNQISNMLSEILFVIIILDQIIMPHT